MKKVNVPIGQLIEDRSFIVDYVAQHTGRIVEKTILDGNIEIEYTGDARNKGLRTILVKNDVRPDINLDSLNVTLNVSKKTDRKVTVELDGDYDLEINWGDGLIQKVVGAGLVNIEHTYGSDGVKQFSIDGYCTILNFTSDTAVILSGFGKMGLEKVSFSNCTNLIKIPKEIPATIKDLTYCFSRCNRLDLSNFSLWDLSNVETMEGMLSFTNNKTLEINNLESENLKSLDFIFYSSKDCALKLNDCKLSGIVKFESLFELAERPIFSIVETRLDNLSLVDKLFFECYSNNELRGGFYVLDSYIGMELVTNLLSGAKQINGLFERVGFPKSKRVEHLFSDIIDTDIELRDLTFAPGSFVSKFFTGIYSSVDDSKSTLTVHGNTLAKVTDFYRFVDNTDLCIVEFNFKEFLPSSPITNLNSMFYSLSNSEVMMGNVVIDHIDLTNIISNSYNTKLKSAFIVDEPMVIKDIVKDSNKITLDFSNSHFKSTVKYGSLAKGIEEFSFINNNAKYDKSVEIIKLFNDNKFSDYESIDNEYRKNLYIDCFADISNITEIHANNWTIFGDLTTICFLRECELLNEFKDISFNNWYIAGKFNENTLTKYIPQQEGFAVGLFKNSRVAKISMRSWTLEKIANFTNICKDAIGINTIDLEGWKVSSIMMGYSFSNCNANIIMKRWTFREDVVLEGTFSNCNNYNRTITLDSTNFNKKATLDKTFSFSNVNVSLLSVKFRGVTTFINTFESLGSAAAPLDISIIIIGLASLDVSNVTVVNEFMKNLGHKVEVRGLEGLLLWSLKPNTAIINPFLGAVMSIDPPF